MGGKPHYSFEDLQKMGGKAVQPQGKFDLNNPQMASNVFQAAGDLGKNFVGGLSSAIGTSAIGTGAVQSVQGLYEGLTGLAGKAKKAPPFQSPFGGEIKSPMQTPALQEGGNALGVGLAALGVGGAKPAAAAAEGVMEKGTAAKLLEYIMPKVGKVEAGAAAARGESGMMKTGILGLGKEVVAPTAKDLASQDAVKGIVNPLKSFASNITALKTGIKDLAEKKLIPFLKDLGGSWNKNTLIGALNDAKAAIPKGLVGDPETVYGRVMDVALEEAKKAPTQGWDSLWNVAKKIDTEIENNFGGKVLNGESMKARDVAVRAARGAVRGYLDEGTRAAAEAAGQPANVYSKAMQQFHGMYDVLANLEEKRTDEILNLGKSGLKQFAQKHPLISTAGASAIGYGLEQAGAGIVKKFFPPAN